MVTSTVLASFVALLCSSFNTVGARIVRRDVVNPPITYPTSGTIWTVDERHNVTWDTSVIPPGTTNKGMIVLGFLDSADGTNEHLDLNNPLATNFPITAGRAEITVPAVMTRDTYVLVLFGDSGNISGKFTIKNISIGSPSSSTTMTASVSLATSTPTVSTVSPTTTDSGASSGPAADTSSGAASSSQSGIGSGSATSAAAAAHSTPTAPASPISNAAASSSIATSAGQTAVASGTTTSNAGARTASRSGAAAWISTMCSLAIVLGFAL